MDDHKKECHKTVDIAAMQPIDTNQSEGLTCYNCSLCDEAFDTQHNLDNHITNQHTEDEQKCSMCDGKFQTLVDLNNHIKNHHNVVV